MDRLNLASRYKYSRKGHFKEAVDKFQGKSNVNIPQSLYDFIIQKKLKHNIKNLTKEHELLFLSESEEDYTDFYGDINLIHSVLTGIKPPNIEKYEEELFKLFDIHDEAYEYLKKEGKLGARLSMINSLNVYFKLMKLLQKVKYNCRLEDFNMLKTRDKLLEHDEAWKITCDYLGWEFIPTI